MISHKQILEILPKPVTRGEDSTSYNYLRNKLEHKLRWHQCQMKYLDFCLLYSLQDVILL